MLKDCVAAKRKIAFEGGEFEVRAFSLTDVAGLVVAHQATVDRVATVIRVRDDIDFNDFGAAIDIFLDVVKESPYLAADIICACADEPDAYGEALKLPLAVQIEALQVIGELTFADKDAVKKFLADARRLVSGLLPPTAAAAA